LWCGQIENSRNTDHTDDTETTRIFSACASKVLGVPKMFYCLMEQHEGYSKA
jgi:hypothetical protein